MHKMSKKEVDISFIDPETMEVRCTFNQCVDKFTVEDFEVHTTENGKEFVSAFRVCEECGQRMRAKGDNRRAYKKWLELMAEKDYDTLDPLTQARLKYGQINER